MQDSLNLPKSSQNIHSKIKGYSTKNPAPLRMRGNVCDSVGTRTQNRLLRKQMLYPVELRNQGTRVRGRLVQRCNLNCINFRENQSPCVHWPKPRNYRGMFLMVAMAFGSLFQASAQCTQADEPIALFEVQALDREIPTVDAANHVGLGLL